MPKPVLTIVSFARIGDSASSFPASLLMIIYPNSFLFDPLALILWTANDKIEAQI
jgi:hypothetical protein